MVQNSLFVLGDISWFILFKISNISCLLFYTHGLQFHSLTVIKSIIWTSITVTMPSRFLFLYWCQIRFYFLELSLLTLTGNETRNELFDSPTTVSIYYFYYIGWLFRKRWLQTCHQITLVDLHFIKCIFSGVV